MHSTSIKSFAAALLLSSVGVSSHPVNETLEKVHLTNGTFKQYLPTHGASEKFHHVTHRDNRTHDKAIYHPTHLPDGAYQAFIDHDGHLHHLGINVPAPSNQSEPAVKEASLDKRQSCVNSLPGNVLCQNPSINGLAFLSLKNQFSTLCDQYSTTSNQIPIQQAIYTYYQGTIMFLCNYAHSIAQNCGHSEWLNALSDITCHCPNYLGGNEWIGSYYKAYGYQNDVPFCSNIGPDPPIVHDP